MALEDEAARQASYEVADTLGYDREDLSLARRRLVESALRRRGYSIAAIGRAFNLDEATIRRDLQAEDLRLRSNGTAPVKPFPEPIAPFYIQTKRDEIVANAQKDRLVTGLSSINGTCRGLSELSLRKAVAALSPEETKQFAAMASRSAAQLRRLAKDLKEVGNATTQAHQD